MKDTPSHLHMPVCIFPKFVIFMSACSWILYTIYVFIRTYIKRCMRSEFVFHNNLLTLALNSYSYYVWNVHSISRSCFILWPSNNTHDGTCKLIEHYHSIYIYIYIYIYIHTHIIFSNISPSENSLCNICMEGSNYFFIFSLMDWVVIINYFLVNKANSVHNFS